MADNGGEGGKPCIAFFGATGGCALTALDLTLNAGFQARALVRTPKKLREMLASRGNSEATIKEKLVIIEGNAKDSNAVQKALVDDSGRTVDKIVFGIGGYPKFAANPLRPFTLDDPTICQKAMETVLSSLENIYGGPNKDHVQQKPILTAISTTGLSSKRDIPLAMVPLYHWLLATPHADKKAMEELVEKAVISNLIRGYVIVRASLLLGSKKGLSQVKVGSENEDGTGAAIGYSISREDVGEFIFEKVIRNDAKDIQNKKVSITC